MERAIIPLIERPAIEVADGVLGNGRPAYDALCVAQWLEDTGADVVIAAEAGGLAAYVAMAAAASPDGTGAKTVLWATGGTRARLKADRRPAGFADLVGDALERAALRAADAVIVPHGATAATGRKKLALPVLPLPAGTLDRPARQGGFSDIALIGGLEEAGGTLGFLDAIERLQGRGLMVGRGITIAGPARPSGRGLSAATVEVRARNWDFPWTLKPDLSARDTLALMGEPRRLSVFAGAEAGFPGLLAAAVETGAAVLAPRTRLTRALLRPDRHKDCLYAPAPGGSRPGHRAFAERRARAGAAPRHRPGARRRRHGPMNCSASPPCAARRGGADVRASRCASSAASIRDCCHARSPASRPAVMAARSRSSLSTMRPCLRWRGCLNANRL